MKFYDLTLPITKDMLVWPGDPGVSIEVKTTVEENGVRLSYFSFGSHVGTHVDAPSHFLENGTGIDAIEPEKLIGTCTVVDLTKIAHLEILPEDIANVPVKKGSRILFKTGNFRFLKQKTFPEQYVSLSLKGAEHLAQKEIYLVGIDFLGIEKRKNPGHPVHKTLLSAGIVNVEGLDLENVPAGTYQIVCLPLKVMGADGAPARVFLIKNV